MAIRKSRLNWTLFTFSHASERVISRAVKTVLCRISICDPHTWPPFSLMTTHTKITNDIYLQELYNRQIIKKHMFPRHKLNTYTITVQWVFTNVQGGSCPPLTKNSLLIDACSENEISSIAVRYVNQLWRHTLHLTTSAMTMPWPGGNKLITKIHYFILNFLVEKITATTW